MSRTPPLVLVVEDEPHISEVLEAYLRRDGFLTERAADGDQALSLFKAARPDLILLDVMLPKRDGFEVLRHIREKGDTPVIMVTARVEDIDRLVGLRMGADDYVIKPFNPPEVVARVKAVLRRVNRLNPPAAQLELGALKMDTESLTTELSGVPLELTLAEFRLLEHLARTPNRVFSRSELMDACFPDSEALERVVDTHISNLRGKMAKASAQPAIETVRSVGYRLRAP